MSGYMADKKGRVGGNGGLKVEQKLPLLEKLYKVCY